MNIRTFIFLILLMTFSTCYSQPKELSIGFSPLGVATCDNITFKHVKGIQVGYKYRNKKKEKDKFIELTYYHCSLEDINSDDEYYGYCEEYNDVDLSLYTILTINKGRRFQIPFYYGWGIGYWKGGTVENVSFHFPVKLRVQYYVSNRMALYVGTTAKLSIGLENFGEQFDSRLSGDIGFLYNF